MKVALFCGGLGTRLRDFSEEIPKPLVPLGSFPIMRHVMNYYAHYGHRDFVLCLGYKGDMIKKHFLDSPQCVSRHDVMECGTPCVTIAAEGGDWRVALVDTGLSSNIGQRLSAVQRFLKDEVVFLANYSDGLTDLPLPAMIEEFKRRKAIGMFVSVRPNASFHFVRSGANGQVLGVEDVTKANVRINGGYFVFSNEVFNYIRPGEELVEEPFERLIAAGKLFAFQYDGFWRCIDTFKDLQAVENLVATGRAPWILSQ